MKIETKYNIGDEIRFEWYAEDILRDKIRGMLITKDGIYYQTETLKLVKEDEVLWSI